MTSELAYNFLYDISEFQEQFYRVLNRTPHERNAGKVDFWIHFFSSIGLTIQNTELNNNKLHINDIAFSISNVPKEKTKILKLAFKVNNNVEDKVILRSISIGENDYVPDNIKYSKQDIQKIETLFWKKTTESTIDSANVDAQALHLNIKTSEIKLQEDNSSNNAISNSNFVKVQPLQKMQEGTKSNVVLDTTLDLIAISESFINEDQATFVNNVEAFYQQLIDLYNTNQQQVLLKSEVAYHGFIYGVLALNYKNKYAVDIYVEQSAGRGFLDLYFLLRKDAKGNNILNSIKIITEFKGNAHINSVADAKNQIDNRAYDHLLGRTKSQNVAIVASDFANPLSKVEVTVKKIATPKQDFISMLINARQAALNENKIKKELKYIYDSTRSDELLDRVILGELLSSDVKKINIFVIQNIPDNHRVSMFVFENQNQEAVILTIIERKNSDSPTYDRILPKNPSKPATRGNIVETRKVTIEEETREAILHIQGELNISAGQRIDITINPNGEVFESKSSADFYCLDIKVHNLASHAPQTQQSYISQLIRRYDINSNIDIDYLIPALQHLDLDHISSPLYDDDRDMAQESKAFNGLREELFKLKDFITTARSELAQKTIEANFKSVLHGMFLHKKYNKKNIQVIPELSAGHGRADLVVVLPNDSVLALELGLSDTDKQEQLKRYIKDIKPITHAEKANGIVLIINPKADAAKDILVGKGFVGQVDHSTGEDSPVKQALDTKAGPSGVQLAQKRFHSDDIHLDVSHYRKRVKFTACLSDSDRKKREASFLCKFSGEDIDKFSVKRTRDIDELQIDNKRFLEYLKDSNDQAKNSQLLELVKIRQIENSDNIVGNYKYLLDQVIQDGGYNNYRQNERIQDIAYNLAKNDFSGISTNLKNTIINAAGQLQLVRGIYGTIVACQTEDVDRDCILSSLGLSYSFLSQPIEDIIVKQGSKFGIKISKHVGQAIPKILGYNTKFVLKILGAKSGGVFLKGAAGGISGVLDIVDIALSAQALKECSDRADTDSKCSDREIRDNIASITFSGVSFVAGIVLTAASAGGPLTIGVALGLMATYGIYSGVSAIVEYEEKYDTTDDENWRIFWHNFAFQSPPEDVQYLAARTEAVNNIVKTAWQDLASMPANVVAYGGGFGKVRLEHVPKQCHHGDILPAYNVAVVTGCKPAYTKPYLESSSATIDMRWSSNDNNYGLSRVLPDHINGATMTCLPEATNAVYEKRGTSGSDSNVIYKCDNSFIIEYDLRQNQHNKSIIINTQLINSGKIIIGPDGPSGIFLLYSHNIDINTYNSRNVFIFLSSAFSGTINMLGHHPINIFNTESLSDNIITFHIEEKWIRSLISKINIFINGKQIKLLHYPSDLQIQYHARKNKEDHVTCESRGNESNSTNIFVDSGGGFNNQRQDIIKNCNKAIIWPYTKVEGNNGTYIFYIRTAGYEKQNSNSEINIIGKGTIIFPETALLKDCEDITYSEADNTVSLRIKLGENIFYRLDIKNYLDKGSKVSNFNLIDKYGSNIVPKIEQGATIINKFELNIEKDIHDSDANDISVVKRYYRKISDKKINYELFGNVKYKEKYYLFGSDAKDIITLDKHTQFVQGGEESDIYIVSNDMDMGTVIIDNGSRDKKLDILMVQSIDDVSLVSRDDNLNILVTKTKNHLVKIDNIIVRNYFVANWYKNLLLVDQEGKAFIPFFNTNKDLTLVPFYSCNIGNRFTIQTDGKVVFDCDLNKIEYYRDNDNLIFFDKIVDYPIITIEQFFNNSLKWQIYHYRNKEEVALLKNNILDYYILEYFSSDIDIEDLRIEFTQLLNDSVVLSEKPLSKKGNIIVELKNHWKGDNFVYHVTSGSSNISAMVKFVSELGDCNDKYLRFNQRDNDVILLHKCSNNKEAKYVKVEIKDYIAAHPPFIFGKTKRMVIDDYHPITTDVQSGASRAKDYKEKIKALYNKIFKEYEIDFSKSFGITHNQQELANGTLIPISSDQERFGIIIFKKIIPDWVTLNQDGDDLRIYDPSHNTHIVIRNWFIDRKYTIPTVELYLGLEPIKIHKWNEDTNMIIGHNKSARLLNKLRLAEEINTSKSIYLRDSSGDELHTLKCVTIVNNLNSTVQSYPALGFSSLEEQINFVRNCKFTESSLVQLKTFMTKVAFYLCCTKSSDLVLPPPNMVNNRLALDVWYELALRGYNYQKASEIYNNISGEFDFDKIIENINKVQNALSNKPNEEVFQRNRRDVNVDDEFIISGASSISSPINELFNWFKNKYYFIFNLVKVPHDSKATEGFLGGEQGPRFKYTDNPYNINDKLANSNTYNVARSSASILELSFSFNNELWSEVWTKLSNLVNFNLLPGVEGTTTDKSKSFNDIYKLIKQSNNHPSDTQINKSNDITSQYDYEIPSSRYKNSVPPSDNDQKLHCVPYSWDSNNQAYVTDAMTCVSPSGQAKIFSNVHQETNFIQTKGYSIQGDIYKNCRPVEFYGRDSVYCAGKHTNMLYTPVFQSKFFDNLNVQIMLFRIGVHLVKKALDYLKIKPKQEYIERHIEIDKETIDLWTKSIEKVQILLDDLEDLENLNQEDLKFINNTNDDLCEIRQNIKNYIEKKMITTKEYEIINERLEALIEELDEIENRYFVDTKEDCNQETSIEQLPHISNDMQNNTVSNRYYIDHNNSQEYYNNSYLLHDTRPALMGLEAAIPNMS